MNRADGGPPTFSIIVAAHNAQRTLDRCLQALLDGGLAQGDELVVVDDGSTDDTRQVAARYPCQVVGFDRNRGSASARNLGAAEARGSHLVFVDADVQAQAGWLDTLRQTVTAQPTLDILITYPVAQPPPSNFYSAYKHVFLHHTYQRIAPGEINGIYSALFCIPRPLFLELGQFNERFKGASFEDIDLGFKARKAGATVYLLEHGMWQHLHHYTLRSHLANDYHRAKGYVTTIFDRAGMPSQVARHGSANNANAYLALNLATSTGIVGCTLAGAALSLLVPVGPLLLAPPVHLACAGLWGAHLALNRRFLTLMNGARGPGFAAAGTLWGVLDYTVMGLGVAHGLARVAARRLLPGGREKGRACISHHHLLRRAIAAQLRGLLPAPSSTHRKCACGGLRSEVREDACSHPPRDGVGEKCRLDR